MRYAIISDLHANRQAFRAVLADIESAGVDQIICLGDIVGYGPSPAEVLSLAYQRVHYFVLGNHDAVIAGTVAADCFNDNARTVIDWTAKQLDAKARAFFAGLPLVLEGDGFRCVHGEFTDPTAFNYLIDKVDALASWATAPQDKILFAGHTHVPGMFVIGDSGQAHVLPPQDFGLEPGKRYIVNVGSVGQPRDGETRASWVLFDASAGNVFFRTTPFDVEGFKADLAAAKLPLAAGFLTVAEQRRLPPLRDQLDFRPVRRSPDAPKPDCKTMKLEAELRQVRRNAARWRKIGFLFLLLFTLAAAVVTWAAPRALRPVSAQVSVTYAAREPVAESAATPGVNVLAVPEIAGAVSATNRLLRWSVMVTEPKVQAVEVRVGAEEGKGAGVPEFVLRSGMTKLMGVSAAAVPAEKGARFSAAAQFRTDGLTSGWMELALLQRLPDGTEKLLENKAVKTSAAGRWSSVRFTLEKKSGGLAQAGAVRLVIRGEFTGVVRVRNCSLMLRE